GLHASADRAAARLRRTRHHAYGIVVRTRAPRCTGTRTPSCRLLDPCEARIRRASPIFGATRAVLRNRRKAEVQFDCWTDQRDFQTWLSLSARVNRCRLCSPLIARTAARSIGT